MGVKGLWKLLMPIGRRISIETLEGKILAIDASIWLTQFLTVAQREREQHGEDGGNYGRGGGSGGRNYDYLVGFLRRLCKLRYQGIRPVLVFDGATPEIKQREIRLRRNRLKRKRETFLSAADDDEDGEESIKRMAKRILLQQLKNRKGGATNSNKSHSNNNKTATTTTTTTLVPNASEAPGFYNPDAPNDPNAGADSTETKTREQPATSTTNAPPPPLSPPSAKKPASSTKMSEQEIIDLIEDDDYLRDDNDDDNDDDDDDDRTNRGSGQDNSGKRRGRGGGDWDRVNVGASRDNQNDDDDDDTTSGSNNQDQNGLYDSRSSRRTRNNSQPLFTYQSFHKGDGTKFQIESVASLSSTQRKDVVEDAQRSRRLQSRREFLKVADDPEGLSHCQLRNFLKSSKLNQDIVKMAQRAAQKEEEEEDDDKSDDEDLYFDDEDNDYRESTNRFNRRKKLLQKENQKKKKKKDTQPKKKKKSRIIYEKYSDNSRPTAHDKERELDKYRRQQLSLLYDEDDNDEDEEEQNQDEEGQADDNDDDDIDWNDDGFNTNRSNHARHQPTRVHVFEDDSDGDEENDRRATANESRSVDGNGGGGGGFFGKSLSSKSSNTNSDVTNPYAPEKTSPRRIRIIDDDDDDDDDDDNENDETLDTKLPFKTDEQIAQELHDEELAKALQGAEHNEHISTNASYGSDILVSKSVNHASSAKSPIDLLESDGEEDGYDQDSTRKESSQESKDVELARSLQQAEYEKVGVNSRSSGQNDGTGFNAEVGDEDDEDDDIEWQDGEDDDEDDDIEWQDGESESDGGRGRTPTVIQDAKTQEKGNSNSLLGRPDRHKVANANCNQDHVRRKENSIDWEDGDKAEMASKGIEGYAKKATESSLVGSIRKPNLDRESSDGYLIESSDDGNLQLTEESNFNVFQHDDWGASPSKKGRNSKEMEAALKHAQETASNLTNWAGRAFRRAVAQHAEENGLDVPDAVKASALLPKESSPPISPEGDTSNKSTTPSVDHVNGTESLSRKANEEKDATVSTTDNYEWFTSAATGSSEGTHEYGTSNHSEYQGEIGVTSSDPFGSNGITDEMRQEVMQLLRLFGVPYITAPAEAEAQCVQLEQLKLVDGIVTEDSDAFVFGAEVVYKNIFDDQKYVECYTAKDARDDMNLTREALVALAMLLGGDYTQGVKGVGIVNGMEVLQAFDVAKDCKSGLLRFRQWLDGFDPSTNPALNMSNDESDNIGNDAVQKQRLFHKKHQSARTRWVASKTFPDPKVLNAYLNPVVDKSRDKFSWDAPDVDGLAHFFNQQIGWTEDETKRIVQPVVDKMEQSKGMHQTRLDSFMRYEDGIKFASIRSKRLKDVLNKVGSQK